MTYPKPIRAKNATHLPTTAVLSLVALFALMLATAKAAPAQTFNVLHTFKGTPDGAQPYASLTMDKAGNLYGTTNSGGVYGWGLVFKLAHKGSGWIMSELYSFPSPYGEGSDGAGPVAGVTIGPDGSLYGTTEYGGAHLGDCCGIVFKLSPPATACKSALCTWTETVLYRFSGADDGSTPLGGVVFDKAGNLYGTTYNGGTAKNGVVYKLTPSAGGWTETVIHNFAGPPDGALPTATMIFDSSGNLYGTTQTGGDPSCTYPGCGSVFELSPNGSDWTERVLYGFGGQNDGVGLFGGVVADPAGNLYGTAEFGGAGLGGTVFELQRLGNNYTFSVLQSFDLGGAPGPAGTLVRDVAGNLYGTVFSGGNPNCTYGCGNVFKLTPSNGSWTYTSLYDFSNGLDGGNPLGGIILDPSGDLYGTTSGMFNGENGSAFEITP